jgi:hypothetical protein
VIPSEHFNTVLYSGNGGTQSITGVGFAPDFVWLKSRPATSGHNLTNTISGATKYLRSDLTAAEGTANIVTAFGSDGFTVGDGNGQDVNKSGESVVAWNWKAGGTAVSNTNGSITSSVSANPSAGFSIATYTAGDSDETIGHGLSIAPEVVIVKRRDNATGNWVSFWTPLTSTNKQLYLNLTNAVDTPNLGTFNATTFRVNGWADVAVSGSSYVAYCFHSVDGYSKVGSYTGNGNANGKFVHCGFRPAFVLIKRSDSAGDDWHMMDTTRSSYNVMAHRIKANTTDAESSTDTSMDALSNGFKLRNTSGARNNGSGTYIFIAFAETPFKYSNAR